MGLERFLTNLDHHIGRKTQNATMLRVLMSNQSDSDCSETALARAVFDLKRLTLPEIRDFLALLDERCFG